MTHEEKVLFLFSKTCTILSKPTEAKESALGGAVMRVAPAHLITRNFDEIYSALEQKLNEKLELK
ncbi:hypothetical protein [Serratia grimesii]|uniref:hypothetical protein n=1 Tax=Serratia grimesii TaxID=82995 RepID=UPI0039B07B34